MHVQVCVQSAVCLQTSLKGGSSNIHREVRTKHCSTPGASEPSAAPRLIPQQTFQPPLDEPRKDRREGIMWGGVEDSFTLAGCIKLMIGLT